MKQLQLMKPPPLVANPDKMTPRQRAVWELVCSTPGGITADEAGALAHSYRERNPHGVDQRCLYCAQDGRSILRSAALKPFLLKRRGSNRWELRDKRFAVWPTAGPVVELAGVSFEDIFGGRAA